MENKDIITIKQNLEKIYLIGKQQSEKNSEKYLKRVSWGLGNYATVNSLTRRKEAIIVDELCNGDNFFRQNIDQYWILYKHALNILEDPSLQFLMRPLMELCYLRIVYYSSRPSEDQAQLIVKYWLCIYGILKDDKIYTSLLKHLTNQKDFINYTELIKNDFPAVEFHKKLHQISYSITRIEISKEIEKSINDLWGGNAPMGEGIDIQFRSMSMILHAHPTNIKLLDLEENNLKYLLRCGNIMYTTGITIILLCEKNGWTNENQKELIEIKNTFYEFLKTLFLKSTNSSKNHHNY